MPAVSQAQRGFLAHKFGPAWMKRHHFANKGKLPEYKHKTKKMNDPSKLIRLAQIDNQLDSIIRFAYDDEDDPQNRSSLLGTTAKVGAAAGVGTAGLYGYGLMRRGVQPGPWGSGLYKAAGTDISNIGSAMREGRLPTAAVGDIGKSIAAGGRGVAAGAKTGWGKLAGLYNRLRGLSSREQLVQFVEPILEPFGAQEKSKIAQEQFPAGKSPGYQRDPTAEILKLPFPELMKLLKQRNILQQQFPGFSKIGRLIELNSELSDVIEFKAIEPLNPKNKGKFTETKKETGESTAELKHSKNPLTRKRAVFAENARKWHHKLDSGKDQLLHFEDLTGKKNWKGQSPATNVRRGAGIGLLAGGPVGLASGAIAGSQYGKRGVIYKKRDPLGHVAEGVAGSAALGTGGMLLGGALGGEKGALIGKAIGNVGGFAGGFGLGARHTLRKRQEELKHGQIFSAKMQRLTQLDSSLDDLIEFEFTEKAKKKFEESKEKIKAKWQKKKGHKSHGGGT